MGGDPPKWAGPKDRRVPKSLRPLDRRLLLHARANLGMRSMATSLLLTEGLRLEL
jgi:hypothetical protein